MCYQLVTGGKILILFHSVVSNSFYQYGLLAENSNTELQMLEKKQ
jgi:hypothetical protein